MIAPTHKAEFLLESSRAAQAVGCTTGELRARLLAAVYPGEEARAFTGWATRDERWSTLVTYCHDLRAGTRDLVELEADRWIVIRREART